MTLELWSDPENDAERSCCSAQAVRGARALAHGLGCPTSRSTCAPSSAPGWSRAGWTATRRGSRPTPACAATAPCASTRCSSSPTRLGADAPRHRPLRARARRRPSRCCGWRADDAQGPELRARRARTRLARAAALPAGGHDQGRGARARRAGGAAVARKPDSQDLCFLAGTDLQRFLERHGDSRPRPGAILDADGRALGSTAARTASPSASATASASRGGPSRCSCSAPTPLANTVTVGPRAALLTARVAVRE